MTNFTSTLQLPEGFNLVELLEVDSTNRYARKLANSGAIEGTLVWAHEQTDGQGRQGRRWISKKGNLFVSLILRPNCSPLRALQFSFVSALAIRDMILPYLFDPNAAKLKWPNDVLVNGRKISGVLLETSTPANGNVDWLVIGSGINLTHHPNLGSEFPSTCLEDEGGTFLPVSIAVKNYANAFKKRWQEWYLDDGLSIYSNWEKYAFGLGNTAIVKVSNTRFKGRFMGINNKGALRLVNNKIGEKFFSSGEVTFIG